MNNKYNYSHAVLHDIDATEEVNIEDLDENKIVYCVSLDHARAIVLQGLSTGWQNITIVDLRKSPRK